MPAVYAHDRFGINVRENMSAELCAITTRYNYAYRMGLQGPDIFFFYHPWCRNRVQKYGTLLHEAVAASFFAHARKVIRKYGRSSSQYAYLLGFICHFTLDSECHPYIEKQIARSGVAHLEIEAEFEKFLLRADHLDPLGYHASDLIYADEDTAAAIRPFYPSLDQKKVLASLKGMKLVKDLFRAPGPLKQGLINSAMKLLHVHHKMNGLMNQRKDNPLCRESNLKLWNLYDSAIPLAVSLQEQFDEYLRTGKCLPERFHRNFE
ncbi:MAG: zinc dependent phospholipase C family protein [Lachnospiraceae bacterium]|nr:zinc dependent phospholipase C family protein [Lachnospiraceae bacterium]